MKWSGKLNGLSFLIRLLSMIVSTCLLIISILGFKYLHDAKVVINNIEDVEESASFGCLCFLGSCFGLLLLLGECIKLDFFFFFFGFLRYRLGRSILYGISGVMILILGKNKAKSCKCNTFLPLIIQGIACFIVFILQWIAILLCGNITAPWPENVNHSTKQKNKNEISDNNNNNDNNNKSIFSRKKNEIKKTNTELSSINVTIVDPPKNNSVFTKYENNNIKQDKIENKTIADSNVPSWMNI